MTQEALTPGRAVLFAANLLLWLFNLLLIYAHWVEPNSIEVSEERLPGQLVTAGKGSVRIVHLADLHVGTIKNRERSVIRAVNDLRPDLVLVTGDISQFYSGTDTAREVLSGLHAAAGVFGTLGDADYSNKRDHCLFCHAADRRSRPPEPAFTILRNRAVRLDVNGILIDLAGVDDPVGPYAGLFPGRPESNDEPDYRILLSSSPSVLPEAATREYDLVLTGDTHGGQVRLPGFRALLPYGVDDRFGLEGWSREGKTGMFISRGVGTSVLPIRFGSRPQVVYMDLPPRRRDVTVPPIQWARSP